MAAPLLEEVRNALLGAAVAQLAQPLDLHLPVLGTRLSPGYEPVDARQVEPFKRTQQGLGGDEPHGCVDLAQAVGAVDEAAILDRDADPDVRMPRQGRCQVGQST